MLEEFLCLILVATVKNVQKYVKNSPFSNKRHFDI